jgi:hypothetical protein
MNEEQNKDAEAKALSRYLAFMHQSTKGLSEESVGKLFSVESLKKYEDCKSSREFFETLDALELPELKNKKFVDELPETREKTRLDKFLETGELPPKEEMEQIIANAQASTGATRKSFYDNVEDGMMTGAFFGSGAGAFIGSSGGIAGGMIGSVAGGVAGAAGGAVGGAFNWLIGR